MRSQLLAFGCRCGQGSLMSLPGIAERSLGSRNRLFESTARRLHIGELRRQIGFACRQPLDVGGGGLMLVTQLIECPVRIGERLFERRSSRALALNLSIEVGFTLRGFLAGREALPRCPPGRIVERGLCRGQTTLEISTALGDRREPFAELGF